MKHLSLFLSLIASLPAFAYVSINTKALPNGTVGVAYTAAISASGGCTPYQWTISGTLPVGTKITTQSKGLSLTLSGTPTTAGTYIFATTVTGCGKHQSRAAYTVVIQPTPFHVVDLSWNASTSQNVAGYNLYRAPDGVNWQRMNTGGLIASTLYSDSTASNSSRYYYAATAVNISGDESAKSAPIQVSIP